MLNQVSVLIVDDESELRKSVASVLTTIMPDYKFEVQKTEQEKALEVSGVFVEIGYIPSTSFVNDLVEMNDKGELVFDPKTLETKTKGLFSAGDCNVSKYKQIVMASGQGATAALSAYEYIKKNK